MSGKKTSLLVVIFLVVIYIILGSITIIPDTTMTHNNLWGISLRIQQYVETHNELPSDLSVLPERKGYGNSIKDGWGHRFIYEITDSEIVTLTSLGKDGQPGGEGENEDIIISYNAKTEEGYWESFDLTSIAPSSFTESNMRNVAVQILEYVNEYRLPDDMSSILVQDGYNIKDDWERPLLFDKLSDDTITITSLGKDGKPGGEGENGDIIVSIDFNEGIITRQS